MEGEFQARKSDPPTLHLEAMDPYKARDAGRHLLLRPNWDTIKLEIMWQLVWKKFRDHQVLADELLMTGDRKLVEGNNWGDRYWGVTQNGYGTGENQLGKILMNVREALRR